MKRRLLFSIGAILLALLVAIGAVAQAPGVWILVACTASVVIGLIVLVETSASNPMRKLGDTIRRLRAGDDTARILSDSNSLGGEVIRHFSSWHAETRSDEMARQVELNRLSVVMQQMNDGVVITGVNGVVQMTNPAASVLFDRKGARSTGISFPELVRHHEIIELWERSVRSRDAVSNVIEIGRNGLFLQVDVTPLVSEDEKLDTVVILHDLTSVRRLETVRRDFISNVSHELRTPLASMRAVIETLQDGALDDPPAATRFLGRAEVEVESMTQMVEELLELSRIESGRVPLRLALVSAEKLVESAVDRMEAQIARRGLELVVQVSAELPQLYVDPSRVEQVLTNLIHNAIKFTPDGGRITIKAREKSGGMVELSVADSGVGIPSHALSRIFERFYKIDSSRTSGGTGLGLSIVRHIVQIHGGDIAVTSQVGQGSNFYFTLPTEQAAERIADAARGIVATTAHDLSPES